VVIDTDCLAERLKLPVVPTTAIHGQGVTELAARMKDAKATDFRLQYPSEVESALGEIEPKLPGSSISTRSLALLWLAGDPVAESFLETKMDPASMASLHERRNALEAALPGTAAQIQKRRVEFVESIIGDVIVQSGENWQGISKKLGNLTTHPLWGMLILAGVMYALYWFVGIFGAGTLVGLLENNLFGEIINPFITEIIQKIVPVALISDLLVGKYGLWTMGITYAFALIFPIVTTFFLAFGIMEDSGYLPRLAALSNRFFKLLGLNGKAVLPMVLGLGCVTMATMTTRVLDKKRERLLVTLLLALAIPCSAQLGVVMGMLAGISLTATMIWGGIVVLILMAVGWLAARLVPGERSQLLVELPPLRMPVFSNVVVKTLARLEWYLKEVVPLFLVGTAILFALDKTGLMDVISKAGEPLVTGWLGLPKETATAFLIGFLRRDFGATGLFIMQADGLLNPLQVVVAMVTITLFIPCFASVMMIAKERGWKTAAGMTVLIFPLAFLIGGLLNLGLRALGWGI
jgi:ferrous iron transport protein B